MSRTAQSAPDAMSTDYEGPPPTISVAISKTADGTPKLEIIQWPGVESFIDPNSNVDDEREVLSALIADRRTALEQTITKDFESEGIHTIVHVSEESIRSLNQQFGYLHDQFGGDAGKLISTLSVQWTDPAVDETTNFTVGQPFVDGDKSLHSDFVRAVQSEEEGSEDDGVVDPESETE